ncbi:MAG: hypothetical protein ACREQY_10280 [Candidatus Binatia bacterium]
MALERVIRTDRAGIGLWSLGDGDGALAEARWAVEHTRRLGGGASLAHATAQLARVCRAFGTAEEAIRAAEEGLATGPDAYGWRWELLAFRGAARACVGDMEGALRDVRCGLELARELSLGPVLPFALLSLCDVLLAKDGAAAAVEIRSLLEEMTDTIRTSGALIWRPFERRAQAELARVLGDDAGAARFLEEAVALFEGMGATGWVARLARGRAAARP